GDPQRLIQLVHPDLAFKEFPALHSLTSHPHNLPIQATPFLGRESELGKITELLRSPSCRLVTLIGPGGIGKTRLAIQAAAEEIERFAHGVYFIPLDPLSSAEFLVSAIAEALKFSFYSKEDEKVQLLNYLREKQLLLILDNFEHLVAGAGMLSEVLNAAPDVKIMVTSRELLNLRGEWIVQVGGMKVPEGEQIDVEGYSAVQLFLHNAQRIRTGAELTDEDKRFVVRICQLVGGLPLGIEIASSWLRSLSCKEIAQEIEKGIDFLETSMRDVPERHRSLRAVFDCSWDLLTETERGALRRLSVFLGGFSREAAEHVAGARLGLLTSLVDKSLLRRHANGRYEMLDILRQYILEKLAGEEEEQGRVLDKHCEYFADFLEQRGQQKAGPEYEAMMEDVALEIENVRIAWDRAITESKDDCILRSIRCLFRFYRMRGWYHEGHEIFSKVVAQYRGKDNEAIFAQLLSRKAQFILRLGDLHRAREEFEESLVILRELDLPSEIAFVLNYLGIVHRMLGDLEKVKPFHEEALKIFRRMDDKSGICRTLSNISYITSALGNYAEAKRIEEEVLVLNKDLGDLYGIAGSLSDLGSIAHTIGDLKKSEELYNESLSLSKKLKHKYGMGRTLNNLGIVKSSLGDYEGAKQCYQESHKIFSEIGDMSGKAASLTNMGVIYRMQGKFEEARKMHEETLEICKKTGYQVGYATSLNHLATTAKDQGDLQAAKKLHAEALAICEKIGNPWLISVTLENCGEVELMLGDLVKAMACYCRGLKIAMDIDAKPLILAIIVATAKVLIRRGERERAFVYLSVAYAHAHVDPELKREVGDLIAEIKTELSRDKITEAEKDAEALSPVEVAEAVLGSEEGT
ncbi:MAG: tetratricopeptide repeat protein, partial [Candidatus Cloacimonadota bacterium]